MSRFGSNGEKLIYVYCIELGLIKNEKELKRYPFSLSDFIRPRRILFPVTSVLAELKEKISGLDPTGSARLGWSHYMMKLARGCLIDQRRDRKHKGHFNCLAKRGSNTN